MENTQTDTLGRKAFTGARPYPVVGGIVHDGERILVIHRSKEVRSAPDAWSVPTGLHEHGKTLGEQLDAELFEEFNLRLITRPVAPAFTFENVPGDGWHWVIMLFMARVASFAEIHNNEPNKHDAFKLVTLEELQRMLTSEDFKWTDGLRSALYKLLPKINSSMWRNL